MEKFRKFILILACIFSTLPNVTHAASTDCGGGKVDWISEGYGGRTDFSFLQIASAKFPRSINGDNVRILFTTEAGRTQKLADARRAILSAYFSGSIVRLFNTYNADCDFFAEVDIVVCKSETDCENLTH